jgi:thymidylate synthase, flavin-dependent
MTTEATSVKPVNLDELELTPARFRSDVTVELVDSMGTEENIVRAARVSTKGAESKGTEANTGLVKYLYREGHGTPFESVVLQWYFETPIFVDRQIMTHRLASTNGESGRYKQMEGVFYVVGEERPLVQVGKVGAYEFELGRPDQRDAVQFVQRSTAEASWENYQKLKAYGISNEVAREHLAPTLYVSRYWTANLRSTLNFISLRKDWGEGADHQSKAQYEISLMVDKMAPIVEEKFPTVWECFVAKGYRVV